MASFLAAVIQLSSAADEAANWASAEALIRRAAGYGAQLIATPENTNFLGSLEEKARSAEPLEGETCTRFATLASELSVHLLLGSFNERGPDASRCYNTSVLFGPDGTVLATYRKLHLFDVDLPPAVCFTESASVESGAEPVVAETPWGPLGLSVCYDLRFPELYRELVRRGARLLAVPSAFTLTTGKDHWYPLLRARAIDTQCYVLAPAQYGRRGESGLGESYGHALIVDPWGQVLASAAEGTGLALAEIDMDRLDRIRAALPVDRHRKL